MGEEQGMDETGHRPPNCQSQILNQVFSDSTSEAKQQKCTKIQSGGGKLILYGQLVEVTFASEKPEVPKEINEACAVDPHHSEGNLWHAHRAAR